MSRRLTDAERLALGGACEGLDLDRVVVHREPGDPVRRAVLLLSAGRAIALGRHLFLPSAHRGDLAVLAHELTHCRQYEKWGALRYYVRGAAEQARHLLSRAGLARTPYDWRAAPLREFHRYGMEQQAQIVEDAYRGDPTARAIVAANSSTSPAVVSQDAIHRTSDRSSFHT